MSGNSLINLEALLAALTTANLPDGDTLATNRQLASLERQLTRHAANPYAHDHTTAGPRSQPAIQHRWHLCATATMELIGGAKTLAKPIGTARILVDLTNHTLVLHVPTLDFKAVHDLVPGGKLCVKVPKGSWHNLDIGAFDPDAWNTLVRVIETGSPRTAPCTLKWYGGSGASRSDLRSTGYNARVTACSSMILFELPGTDSSGRYPDLTMWGTHVIFE
ncbi:NS25 [Marbled eel reovirus]|nr:NS25 [Marbled eel reovirus]